MSDKVKIKKVKSQKSDKKDLKVADIEKDVDDLIKNTTDSEATVILLKEILIELKTGKL